MDSFGRKAQVIKKETQENEEDEDEKMERREGEKM